MDNFCGNAEQIRVQANAHSYNKHQEHLLFFLHFVTPKIGRGQWYLSNISNFCSRLWVYDVLNDSDNERVHRHASIAT